MKKIAFQGRRGAYSESAAYHLFGNDIEVIPMDTFEQIFQGIETGAVDGGAIPIENSTAGSIYDNYDLLYKWRHPIVGEVKLQISHSLCALPGTKLEDIKEVLSHPQGLAQCSRFFGRNPQIKSTAFYDTAGSAEEVAKRGDKTVGAIASVLRPGYLGRRYRELAGGELHPVLRHPEDGEPAPRKRENQDNVVVHAERFRKVRRIARCARVFCEARPEPHPHREPPAP